MFEPGAVACGCLRVASPRTLAETAFFVPKQTGYPAHFMVEVLHQTNGSVSPWAEILVFTESTATAPWLVAESSGFAPLSGTARLATPATDRGGYLLTPSNAQHGRALQAAHQLASLWQQAKDTGRVPVQTSLDTRGRTGTRLGEIAAYPQDGLQSNGLPGHAQFYVDPTDLLVESSDAAGVDLACQPIRETMAYRATPGTFILQDPAQTNWGSLLAPGHYTSVTNHGAWQTCFLIPPGVLDPILVLNQDEDGGVPVGR